ncbi:MAG: response regulator [Candidatus Hodarchaeales archaeon]|jgi:two-component system chemotaxis response regulator CheY
MKKGNLMIVEDNRELCDLYERILSIKGFLIVCKAHDGREAVEYCQLANKFPDIIIMDYRMPLKDGITASQEILQLNPGQKIIFASADGSIKKQAAEMGLLQFKKKPFDIIHLLKNIEKALAS